MIYFIGFLMGAALLGLLISLDELLFHKNRRYKNCAIVTGGLFIVFLAFFIYAVYDQHYSPKKTMPKVPKNHPIILEMSCQGSNGEVIQKGTEFNLTVPNMAKYKVCVVHKVQVEYKHMD